MEIEVQVKIEDEITAKIHMDDVIEKINEMPIEFRWNYIAKIINEVSVNDHQLKDSHKQIIINYLEGRLTKLKEN